MLHSLRICYEYIIVVRRECTCMMWPFEGNKTEFSYINLLLSFRKYVQFYFADIEIFAMMISCKNNTTHMFLYTCLSSQTVHNFFFFADLVRRPLLTVSLFCTWPLFFLNIYTQYAKLEKTDAVGNVNTRHFSVGIYKKLYIFSTKCQIQISSVKSIQKGSSLIFDRGNCNSKR